MDWVHMRAAVLEAKGHIHFLQAQLTAWHILSYLLILIFILLQKNMVLSMIVVWIICHI